MKIGFALGYGLNEFGHQVWDWLVEGNCKPDFVLACAPSAVESAEKLGVNVIESPQFNSLKARTLLSIERPDAVIVWGCGIIDRITCETFPNTLVNVHAGKLPNYRGINNVEWTYFEDEDLYCTIHFIAPDVDSGDIILEQKLEKLDKSDDVEEIRMHAFEQSYKLLPKALKLISDPTIEPIKQEKIMGRTNRYAMHPFLKRILLKKLST